MGYKRPPGVAPRLRYNPLFNAPHGGGVGPFAFTYGNSSIWFLIVLALLLKDLQAPLIWEILCPILDVDISFVPHKDPLVNKFLLNSTRVFILSFTWWLLAWWVTITNHFDAGVLTFAFTVFTSMHGMALSLIGPTNGLMNSFFHKFIGTSGCLLQCLYHMSGALFCKWDNYMMKMHNIVGAMLWAVYMTRTFETTSDLMNVTWPSPYKRRQARD